MARLIAGIGIGVLGALLLVVLYASAKYRTPGPTSQAVNQPTKARQIRVLKPGLDRDLRRFKMQHEKH